MENRDSPVFNNVPSRKLVNFLYNDVATKASKSQYALWARDNDLSDSVLGSLKALDRHGYDISCDKGAEFEALKIQASKNFWSFFGLRCRQNNARRAASSFQVTSLTFGTSKCEGPTNEEQDIASFDRFEDIDLYVRVAVDGGIQPQIARAVILRETGLNFDEIVEELAYFGHIVKPATVRQWHVRYAAKVLSILREVIFSV
jgi:hypothetical protein